MRILFIHNRYLQSAGGEDTTVDAEIELLKSKGHEVELLLFDNASTMTGIYGKLKAALSAIYNSRSARALKRQIGAFKPEVIHVHNFFFTASPSVIIASHNQRIPVIVTVQNFRMICANSLLLRNNKVCELCVTHTFPWYGVKYKCYHNSAVQSAVVGAMAAVHKVSGTWKNKVDLYIIPANFIRSRLVNSSFNAPDEKFRIKRNFTKDPGFAAGQTRQSYYLFVGRLSEEKGVELLLKAWIGLPGEKLVIAGDGPERERLAGKFGQNTNVEFVGKQNREGVLALMKQCRALIFPSLWYEGSPLTIIEALFTGAPVIASDLGAMPEMVQHGVSGALFKSGSEEAIRDAVRLFNDYIRRSDYSLYEGARQRYLSLYHPDKCYDEVMKIYESVSLNQVVNKSSLHD